MNEVFKTIYRNKTSFTSIHKFKVYTFKYSE